MSRPTQTGPASAPNFGAECDPARRPLRGRRKREGGTGVKRSFLVVAAVMLVVAACSSDKKNTSTSAASSSAAAGGAQALPINVDAPTSGTQLGFTAFFPNEVTLHAGDTLDFNEHFSGE